MRCYSPATMPKARITIVEDEPAIAEILQYNLEQEGFEVSLLREGDLALPAIRRDVPDLILLDLMLPGLDGLELTRLLKRDPATAGVPLIFVTARDQETDRIVGLELGADDYITKPFSPREVVLRVKAVLRRSTRGDTTDEILSLGDLRIDIEGHRAWVAGEEIRLTATEFRLLTILAERRGRVQRRGDLLRDVWDYRDDVDSRTVDTHIRRLRHKLGPAGERIETVVGVGYRLRADS
ncbi:MAG: response regulator [Acidobacteriota bacterium]